MKNLRLQEQGIDAVLSYGRAYQKHIEATLHLWWILFYLFSDRSIRLHPLYDFVHAASVVVHPSLTP